ncbi:hypothetical protein [Vibrio crassostreae]|uniref:hypothetical protein n=1 Tax=Vibrio crassostreae TaxID=246167 RepID=UPI000368A841|nr:hypothetical protein [Vibrio crassostreae]OED91243.1 hypothetical protein A141_12325 [Vibrio crassostreae ZF-91]
MSYIIYSVSWLLAVFIHINTLKRTSLTNTKEALIDEIYSLLEANKNEGTTLEKETTFSHKFARIENKIKEFNTLCKNDLVSAKHDDFKSLFTFDIESDSQMSLTTKCYDAVEYVDKTFHRHIQNKYSFFYLNRFELAGTVCTLAGFYVLIKIVLWLHGGNI